MRSFRASELLCVLVSALSIDPLRYAQALLHVYTFAQKSRCAANGLVQKVEPARALTDQILNVAASALSVEPSRHAQTRLQVYTCGQISCCVANVVVQKVEPARALADQIRGKGGIESRIAVLNSDHSEADRVEFFRFDSLQTAESSVYGFV